MANLEDQNQEFAVAYLIHNPVITDANAQPTVPIGQRLCARWPRLDTQLFGRCLDPARHLLVKFAKLPKTQPDGNLKP